MLERAAAALKANEAAALNEFNDKHDRRFHDRDLYVFCNTLSDGKMTAHPNPSLIGRGFPRHHWRYAYAKLSVVRDFETGGGLNQERLWRIMVDVTRLVCGEATDGSGWSCV